ncbi:ATP-binding cassette domain-containing protein [Thiotrichales bacterium 19S3-7]|nr:ATP-binding cassette domain-containing protein [Thiotrichales bacterium 19S3-7]MCF6802371.1 ATP-binding cassette domain-containing protein [Thiotrichales bacterium 19S3-11]
MDKTINDDLFCRFFKQDSEYLRLLRPLLRLLKWQGSDYQLAESLPCYSPYLHLSGFLHCMRLLGFQINSFKSNLADLDSRHVPCLYVSHDKKIIGILKEKQGNHWLVFDANKACDIEIDASQIQTGRIYIFHKKQSLADKDKFKSLFQVFKGFIPQLVTIGIVLNLLMLSVPFFVMVAYDRVISSSSLLLLFKLLIGVVIAMIGIVILYQARSKIFSYISMKFNNHIGVEIIKHILSLPIQYTDYGNTSAQIARIKDFDRVRDAFVNQYMILLLDIPLTIIYLIAIAFIGGAIIWIPVFTIIASCIIIFIFKPYLTSYVNQRSKIASKYQRLLLETFSYLKTIRLAGAHEVWLQRLKSQCAENEQLDYRLSNLNTLISLLYDLIIKLSILSVLILGTFMILNNAISIGGLLACMILIWRIFMPLKMLFISLTSLGQMKRSINQIKTLMQIPSEGIPKSSEYHKPEIKGDITLQNASLAYPSQNKFALMNISVDIQAGALVGIIGENGSGKSTLLKAILNLYPLKNGQILISGTNIEQMNPYHLRQSISYVSKTTQLFYGTIKQNLTLVNPLITDGEIDQILNLVGLKADIEALACGINTRIKENDAIFSDSFKQRLGIARALVKSSSILLIDDKHHAFDKKNQQLLINILKKLKGKVTIILISHNEEYLALADQVMVLEKGNMIAYAPPLEVLKHYLKR